ncbi:hypothetical protein BDU57DRAFT_596442 [Ampelomyces quisqualis]|uniref:Uncharacterized protein n=1 Tax=Ampelomyces quisqualis TaxID=50730 RepID=A0A6A5QJ04_AMPQU|nr:hypothetical protein BDU57DRAFT_596442 [Ampelomyces quisqualis]
MEYREHPQMCSVKIERKNGVNCEGLTTRILQVEHFHNWLEIPVDILARDYGKNEACHKKAKHSARRDECGVGPFACHYNTFWLTISASKTKKWECAVPIIPSGDNPNVSRA